MEMMHLDQMTQREKIQPLTSKNIVSMTLYMLLSFIFSLFYFIVAVVGFSLGISTIIIWVGIPILIGTFEALHGLAYIERKMIKEMLGLNIPYIRHTKHGFAMLKDAQSWKYLIYALVKFPIGVMNFCISLPLIVATLAFFLMPIGYIIATWILLLNGIELQNETVTILYPLTVNITGHFDNIEFIKSFVGIPLGIVTLFLSKIILRWLANLNSIIAKPFLSAHITPQAMFETHKKGEQQYNPIGATQSYTTPAYKPSTEGYYASQEQEYRRYPNE